MKPPATQIADETTVSKNGRKIDGYYGNTNALRHGLRACQLPPGCTGIVRRLNDFRRAVEKAVLEAKGQIGLADATAIHSAMRAERHAQLCERWLRVEKDLTPAMKKSFAREILDASDRRDRCLQRLGLTSDPKPSPGSIYDIPVPALHTAASENL